MIDAFVVTVYIAAQYENGPAYGPAPGQPVSSVRPVQLNRRGLGYKRNAGSSNGGRPSR